MISLDAIRDNNTHVHPNESLSACCAEADTQGVAGISNLMEPGSYLIT